MRLSKAALLKASDIVERDVELPALDGSVRIRSLPAAYANQAVQDATKQVVIRGEQTMQIDVNKVEALQVLHGLIDPKLDSVEEAMQLAEQLGPSWKTIVEEIGRISGVDREAIEKANRMFQPGRSSGEPGPASGNGASAGHDESDLHSGVGAGDADAGG